MCFQTQREIGDRQRFVITHRGRVSEVLGHLGPSYTFDGIGFEQKKLGTHRPADDLVWHCP